MHIRRLLIAVSGAAALVAPDAAHAGAVTQATYDVAYSGAYRYDATEGDPEVYVAARRQSLSFGARAVGLVVEVGHESAETAVAQTSAVETTLTGSYDQRTFDPPAEQHCTTTQVGPAQPGLVGARTEPDGTTTIDFEPFQRVDGRQACTAGALDDSLAVLGAPLSARVTVPREEAGAETIRLPVELGDAAPCPTFALTQRCDASLVGEVLLTRTSVRRAPDPAPPALPAPAPPAIPTPTPSDDDLLAPLVVPDPDDALLAPLVPRQRAQVDRSGRTLRFRAACRQVCTGTLTLRGVGARRAATRAATPTGRTLARVAVRVTDDAQRVEVRLSQTARRRLAGARSATATVVLRDTISGQEAVRTMPVRRP